MYTPDGVRTEFDFIEGGVLNSTGLLGSGYPVSKGFIQLLDFPSILKMKITMPNQINPHGFQASLDRAQLFALTSTDPTTVVNFQLYLTDSEQFE